MYSVDLVGAKVKRSFGSALKLISPNMTSTTLLCLATALAFYMAPSAAPFVKTVLHVDAYKSVKVKLLPKSGWFKM
jgi:hypothetical protein